MINTFLWLHILQQYVSIEFIKIDFFSERVLAIFLLHLFCTSDVKIHITKFKFKNLPEYTYKFYLFKKKILGYLIQKFRGVKTIFDPHSSLL